MDSKNFINNFDGDTTRVSRNTTPVKMPIPLQGRNTLFIGQNLEATETTSTPPYTCTRYTPRMHTVYVPDAGVSSSGSPATCS